MKILRSFVYAWQGIKICFTSETNFKVHIVSAVITISLGIGFKVSAGEWLVLLFSIAFVIAMEMMNTTVEKLSDVIQKNIHPGIKAVKDIAAGAVLVAATASFIAGIIIFLPKIIDLIRSF